MHSYNIINCVNFAVRIFGVSYAHHPVGATLSFGVMLTGNPKFDRILYWRHRSGADETLNAPTQLQTFPLNKAVKKFINFYALITLE